MSGRRACDVLGCECACHRVRQRQVPRLWTPTMDDALTTALDRGEPVRTVATRMALTEASIRWRIRQLGRSTRDGWYSRQDVARLLGVGRRAVDRWWRLGLLPVAPHGSRWTRVRRGDLLRFVGAHAGVLFAPDAVADAGLRSRAEVAARSRRRGATMDAVETPCRVP